MLNTLRDPFGQNLNVTKKKKAEEEEKKNEEEEEKAPVTMEDQFVSFSKAFEPGRDGATISLYRSDYWMRQAHIIDDRHIKMTDTAIIFNNITKLCKSEISMKEWFHLVSELCRQKGLDEEQIREQLRSCGLPGEHPVHVPAYRDFFTTYRSKKALIDTGVDPDD